MQLTRIRQFMDSGCWAEAEQLLRSLLEKQPQDEEIQEIHRKVRLELSRLCEMLVSSFEYLGDRLYICNGKEFTVSEYEHLKTGMVFVLLPPVGEKVPFRFVMGSSKYEPERSSEEEEKEITFYNRFLISKTPVTQGVWEKIMCENPSYFRYGSQYPVDSVRWYDCLQFCRKVELLLPSEMHWEYSCRSGTSSPFCFGDHLTLEQSNFYGHDFRNEPLPKKPLNHTTKVASFPPNAYGIYDMHGNVWESCAQCLGQKPEETVLELMNDLSGSKQVFRGGSFSDGESYCRSAFRLKNTPDFYGPDFGFRLMKLIG